MQRQATVEILEKATGPLSAQKIFELTRREVPDVGLSTVYRTLKMLQDTRLVHLVLLPDGVARYEKTGRGAHHFQCRVCGQIWTLPVGVVPPLRGARLAGGFVVEAHESILHGKCSTCNTTSREHSAS